MSQYFNKIIGSDEQIRGLVQKVGDLDKLVERCKATLNLNPADLRITLYLVDTVDKVQSCYKQRYSKECDYKSFISLDTGIIWLSLEDAYPWVLAHEIGHAIVEAYFGKAKRPPCILHELMAQYCEKHFDDLFEPIINHTKP